MARQFTATQYGSRASAVVIAEPFTMACWFLPDNLTGNFGLMNVANSGVDSEYFQLGMRGGSAGDPIWAALQNGGGFGVAESTVGPTVNVWNHACAVFASTTSRTAYCNGGNGGTDTAAGASPPSGNLNITALGSFVRDAVSQPMEGRIAEAAIWGAALDAAEVAALATGLSPLLIRPQSLVAYWPLVGNDSPELDRWKNRYDLTLTGPPTKADHPRIYYPSQGKVFGVSAGAANFLADIAAAATVVAALSVGAGFAAAATGTATVSASLVAGAGLAVSVTGTATASATLAEEIPIGEVSVRLGVTLWRTRVGSMGIRDLLNAAPNTCSFEVRDTAPTVGQAVEILIGNGTITPDMLFSGSIVAVDQVVGGRAENQSWVVTCQDHTRTINRRKVRKRYAQQSATPIALDLIANYTTGFTTGGIVAGLPTVTGGIDYTEEDLLTCLTRLASRIGGYSDVDYEKDVRLFLTDVGDQPDPLEAGYCFLHEPKITPNEDLSQIRTRVFVEGGGAQARNAVAIGATSIPVTDASWYSGTGGIVVSGPQRITYTGKGEVGGPAAPTAAQSLVVGNLGSGEYTYKVSQIDSGVEGPLSAASTPVTIDPVPVPSSAVTAANGSFPPPAAPTAGAPSGGGSVTSGAHYYATTFVTASGETTPSSNSSTVTAGQVTPPVGCTDGGDVSGTTGGSLLPSNEYAYKVTFLTAVGGETTGSSSGPTAVVLGGAENAVLITHLAVGGPGVTQRRIYRQRADLGNGYHLVATVANNNDESFTDTVAEASLGALIPSSNTADVKTVALTSIQTGPAGTTARKVYRTTAGGSQLKLLTTISNNSATTFSDTIADGSLGANAPTTNTAGGALGAGTYGWKVTYVSAAGETTGNTAGTVAVTTGSADLTNVPVSADARVTARNIYRTTVGGSTYLYEGTIANNSGTTFSSTMADGSLGSAIPTTNTTAAGKINLTSIATGGGGVTARKLYRTVSGGATYKLVATISDNVTTTYLDNIADGSLGVVAPGDIITALTGIPASGAGSVLYEIAISSDVNILEQCDDVAAQAALMAMEGGDSDGIYEHFIQDRRLASAEARATGNADLALFAYPIVTLRYATRDPKTRSGKTIHVDLPELNLSGDFTIQSVQIDQIGTAQNTWPRYTVEASSVRFSLEDVLRRLQLVA